MQWCAHSMIFIMYQASPLDGSKGMGITNTLSGHYRQAAKPCDVCWSLIRRRNYWYSLIVFETAWKLSTEIHPARNVLSYCGSEYRKLSDHWSEFITSKPKEKVLKLYNFRTHYGCGGPPDALGSALLWPFQWNRHTRGALRFAHKRSMPHQKPKHSLSLLPEMAQLPRATFYYHLKQMQAVPAQAIPVDAKKQGQPASPFGCLNHFYFNLLSNFLGSLPTGTGVFSILTVFGLKPAQVLCREGWIIG